MKIKKLSVLGFKSIMEKVEILFPLGISGIVGPNGCGKSNIVDAIRWCLGEQSPKQLRGRSMEDIIFSGTREFKPMGMAEVSLQFENGDGSFPQGYTRDTELSVTRRLFRSGESEYLINNVPCRLKDILEVFMDTGLGNKAYSIIGQGQIGSIVEQKPEDTRIMLEEAAGITKYRRKVVAAQKKIDQTEGNLQRVEDILGEVERQMRSLKRQASKATRYKTLSERIQELELSLHANTYHRLTLESGNTLKSTEALLERELALTTELARHQAHLETMALELEAKDNRLSGLRQRHLTQREGVHRKEAALEALAGEMKMHKEMEARLEEEKREIGTRLVGLSEERQRIQTGIEERALAARDLAAELHLKETRLNSRREFLETVTEEHREAGTRLTAGTDTQMGLSHESGYLRKMIDQITDGRTRLEDEQKHLDEKREKIIGALEHKGLTRDSAAEKLSAVESSMAHHTEQIEELDTIRGRMVGELRTAEAHLHTARTRLASLQALAENFEGYKVGVRTVMKAQDLEPLRRGRILGIVADMLQVDPAYEQAVEAVLADKLQYVIVESLEDGIEAIDYLKKKARGRSSFVPLGEMRHNGAVGAAHGLPTLEAVVSVPETHKPLVRALLGDAVLVDTLAEAVELWRRNGTQCCFVTPEGDIVDERGVVSGGKLTRSSQGILGRKREIAELKELTAVHDRQVDDLTIRVEHVEAEIQDKKDAVRALNLRRESGRSEINEIDKVLFRLGQELDQVERLSERIVRELDTKGKEQSGHEKELKKIEEALRRCETRHLEAEEYFHKKELELKECRKEYEGLRDELVRIKGDERVLGEKQRSLIREKTRLEDYSRESSDRLKKIEEDIALGRRRYEECVMRRETLETDLARSFDALKDAEEVVHHAEQERQEFQFVIKTQEKKAEQVRGQVAELKESITRARMEHSELTFKMNNVTEVVREKFDVDLVAVLERYLREDFSGSEVEAQLAHHRTLRQRLGEVNLTAIKEHEALKERHEFISAQREDLVASIEALRAAIRKINKTSLEKFGETFHAVDAKLKEIFPILFNGGSAGLKLTDETSPLDSGVLVEVQPPGKKLSHMGLLSGGEKALVAMALLFAIYMIKPSPFCLLDEVDAPLDEANIERFNDLLMEIKRSSQIIMVTHSRRTMEIADRLFGVTMEKAGISKTVSVDIEGLKTRLPPRNEARPAAVH